MNSTGIGHDFAEFLVEMDHHGTAADFAVVVDFAGGFLRSRERHVEEFEAGGAGHRIHIHGKIYDGTLRPAP